MRYSDIGLRIVKGALPAEGELMIHIDTQGESFNTIAAQYGTDASTLAEINGPESESQKSILGITIPKQVLVPYDGSNQPSPSSFSDLHPNSPLPVVSTKAELDSIGDEGRLLKKMIVLGFWEVGNQSSEQQISTLEELAQSMGNKVFFGVVDIGSDSPLPSTYGITSSPHVLIIQGKRVIGNETNIVGLNGRLQNFLQKELAKTNAPPVYSRATKIGPKGKGPCEGDSFYDLIEGGTCWKCPPGYTRTIESITGSRACVKQ
jgi:hypothetical protein